MLGKSEMLCNADPKFSFELREAMNLKTGNNQVGLPLHSDLFNFEKGMTSKMHKVLDVEALQYLSVTQEYLDVKKIYSPIALHYESIYSKNYCVQFLIFF